MSHFLTIFWILFFLDCQIKREELILLQNVGGKIAHFFQIFWAIHVFLNKILYTCTHPEGTTEMTLFFCASILLNIFIPSKVQKCCCIEETLDQLGAHRQTVFTYIRKLIMTNNNVSIRNIGFLKCHNIP